MRATMFPSQLDTNAWTAEQLAAVAARRPESDVIEEAFGDPMRSHLLKADGNFISNLGVMKIRAEDAIAISKLIAEHLWIFVLDASDTVIDVLPTSDAAAQLYAARRLDDEMLYGEDLRPVAPLGILDPGAGADSEKKPLVAHANLESGAAPTGESTTATETAEAPARAHADGEGDGFITTGEGEEA